VVTPSGVENFTDFLPSRLEDIEKLVGTGGVVQKVPPQEGFPLRIVAARSVKNR